MLRKFFAVAVLSVATITAVAAPKAAFAIEYICSCSFCQARPGYGCYDMNLNPPFNRTSCSTYYAKYCD